MMTCMERVVNTAVAQNSITHQSDLLSNYCIVTCICCTDLPGNAWWIMIVIITAVYFIPNISAGAVLLWL